MNHELKILPKYFDVVRRGEKPFEVRKNDRTFAVGDTLILHEFGTQTLGNVPPKLGIYTGRRTEKIVTYIMPGGQWGVAADHVVLGIR